MEVTRWLLMFAVVIFVLIIISDGKIFSNKHNELLEHNIVHLKTDSRENNHPHRFRRAADTASKPPPGFSIANELPDKHHNEAVVHWSGENSSEIFVLTRDHQHNGTITDSRLWGSSDYGSTFQDKSKLFPSGTIIRYFYVSPVNKSKLVFTDVNKQIIYATDDEAKTVKINHLKFRPDHITFHPVRDDWLMAYSYNDSTLHVSRDLANTWTKVHDHVGSRYFWAVKGQDNDDSTIHLEILDPVAVTYSYKACAFPYCQDVTNDKMLGNIDIYSLIVQDEYIFAQKSEDLSSSKLFVSYKRQTFRRARFAPTFHPLDFNILDSDEGQIFLAVNHQERVVNLYLSDETGHYYTKTLGSVVNLHSPVGMMVDLYEVHGISGVYISNQYVAEQTAKSYITFDKGANWTLIPAPEKDRNGKSTNCKLPECSLHLHLMYSTASFNIPYILSEDNAPGIIIAHGVMGNELKVQTANVFISRNGGLTWSELFQGTYMFNILDQGGAMVAVDDAVHSARSDIKYSCDEGMTWENYTFASKIVIDGVLNEPGITTLIVSIYGHEKPTSGWTIVKLDFSKILTEQCQDKDYTLWTPTDQLKGHDCILGQKITYERRKPTAKCANGKDYQRPLNATACKCTQEDYECDFGYVDKKKGVCKVTSWFDPSHPPDDCPEGTFYYQTNGYRKVASDKCQGGDIHRRTKSDCSIAAPGKLSIKPLKKLIIKKNENAQFELIQEKGSKKSTKYTWNFGDGHTKPNLKGYDGNYVQTHNFTTDGRYTVSVTATNTKGHKVVNYTVDVQDEILALDVIVSHGVQIYHEVCFNATLNPDIKFGDIVYIWLFGDEQKHEKPMLSWSPSVKHNFTKNGTYTVMVQAGNAVSTVFQRFNIKVFSKVKTVRLSFSPNMETANRGTPAWRHLFEISLREKLMSVLAIERNRLEVVLLTVIPSLADVSILPALDGADIDLDKIANDLVKSAQHENIHLTVNGYELVLVVNASILPDILHPSKPGADQSRDFTAVYICVPILLIAIFASLLVVMHYKKKFMEFRRYSLLRDRNATDTLLDEDEDDPPLDPNPDFRLADDDDDNLVGQEPALVMMTDGRSQGGIGNQIEC